MTGSSRQPQFAAACDQTDGASPTTTDSPPAVNRRSFIDQPSVDRRFSGQGRVQLGLTRAAPKAQCPLMMTIFFHVVLAFALAANAAVAVAAISKLEEPTRSTR